MYRILVFRFGSSSQICQISQVLKIPVVPKESTCSLLALLDPKGESGTRTRLSLDPIFFHFHDVFRNKVT